MVRKASLVLAVLMALPCVAAADTFSMTYSPTPGDMFDLDHYTVYTWGIDVPLAAGESVIGAELSFDNIRNWNDASNDLFIHLLDWAELGLVEIFDDNQEGGDYFATFDGPQTLLTVFEDLPETPQDITYTFTADELVTLNAYLADGRVGLGLDPDCHYYNDGIELTLVIPEPATVALVALVLPMLYRRRVR